MRKPQERGRHADTLTIQLFSLGLHNPTKIPVTKRMHSDSRFAPVNRFLNCNDIRLGKKIPLETYE